MRRIAYLLLVLMASMLLVVACGKKPKVIPDDTFAKIYEDMFISDQWLNAHADQRKVTDTTWFYDPIFEKYGYTREDYYASVAYYLKDTDRYSKIFKKTQESLEAQLVELQVLLNKEFTPKKEVTCIVPLYADFIKDLPFKDSIRVELDSTGVFKLQKIQYDTTFSGPKIIVREKPVEVKQDSVEMILPLVEDKIFEKPAELSEKTKEVKLEKPKRPESPAKRFEKAQVIN